MIVRGIAKSKITNKFRNGFVKLMKNRSFGNCKLKSPRWNLWNSKSPKLGFEDIGREVGIKDRLFFPMGTLRFQLWLTTVIGCHQKKIYLCREILCWPHVVSLQPSLPLPVALTFQIFCSFKGFQQRLFS